jgi:hypothetical protein
MVSGDARPCATLDGPRTFQERGGVRDLACVSPLWVRVPPLAPLRRASLTGRPLGGEAWIKTLETATGRALAAPPIGRPRSRQAPAAPEAGEGVL